MIGKLLGLRIRAFLGSFNRRGKSGDYQKPSVGRLVLISLVFLYLVGIFAFLFTSMAITMQASVSILGAPWIYFAVYALLPFAVIFTFSIFETKSALFECKDNAFLLSLPIKPRDIVVSRILSVLLLNYAEAAVMMWPFLIVYAIGAGIGWELLGGVLAFVFVPLLATSLSTGIGYLIARISARVKRKTLVTMALYLLFFVAYFWLYTTMFSASTEGNVEDIAAVLATITERLPALRFVGEASMLTPIPTLIFVAVTLAVTALVFYRVIATFLSVSTASRGESKAVYRERRAVRRSAFFAIAKKELHRFTSSATYMMNTAMGILLSVVLAGFLCFTGADGIEAALGIPLYYFSPVLVLALVIATLMNYPSACAVSLEGKSLWQLRALPVRAEVVLLAKCVPHVLICSVTTVVCGIAMAIAMRANFLYLLALIVLPVLANVVSALFGIFINTAFPKLEFTTEAQPVKSSLATMIVLFTQMIFGLALVTGGLILSLQGLGILALIGTAVLLLFLGAVLYVLVTRRSAKKIMTL